MIKQRPLLKIDPVKVIQKWVAYCKRNWLVIEGSKKFLIAERVEQYYQSIGDTEQQAIAWNIIAEFYALYKEVLSYRDLMKKLKLQSP